MEQKCRRDFAFVSIAETCNEAKVVVLQKGIPEMTFCVVKIYMFSLADVLVTLQ